MAAELERLMRGHAEAVEECAVLGLNVAVFEPVAQQQKKKKTKAKPTEQEVTTFTVPESNLDRDIRRIIETMRLSTGSMFAACGAMALSEDTVLVGLIERENKTEKEKAVHFGDSVTADHIIVGEEMDGGRQGSSSLKSAMPTPRDERKRA